MWDALMRIFQDPATPPAAREMTVEPTKRVVAVDPEMPGLPSSARPIVGSINDLMRVIERRVGADAIKQPMLIEMEQMRDVHLPKLIRSYVEIPEPHRREIFNKTQKSASVHLCGALEDMMTRLNAIDRDLSAEHIETFEDNMRFISRQYGTGSDSLG